ncbi:MAG: nucleotidyltransferase family protein [Gemmatimonadaceae bacterium]
MSGVGALLLAAGLSTRIAAVTGGQPKPLISIAGQPILVHNVRWLAEHGIRDVWVNLHHRADLVRAALGDGSQWGVHIRYSEEPRILGTAGAARKLLDEMSEPFLIVYGDNLVRFDLTDFLTAHRRAAPDLTIAVFDESVPNTGIAGGRVQLNQAGAVVAFAEGGRRNEVDSSYVNAGVYVMRRDILRPFPAGTFLDWGTHVFPTLLREMAPIMGYPISGFCLGLDTSESYERGLALIAAGQVRLP